MWAQRISGQEARSISAPVDEVEVNEWAALGVKTQASAGGSHRDFRVADKHWPVLAIFLSLQTQWRVLLAEQGLVYLGLDYVAAEALMRMQGVKNRKDVFAGLQVMEAAAMSVFNGSVLSDADHAWARGEAP